jgi:multidrug efflux pump subunit AcrA (membrane-fusion protein)
MLSRIKKAFRGVKTTTSLMAKRAVRFIDRWPMHSFFFLLGLLLILIIAGNFIRQPKIVTKVEKPAVKTVTIYQADALPRLQMQAQIEKSGVVQISALSSGVVYALYAKEGTHVRQGQTLAYISTNYHGANIASPQRSIAEKQLQDLQENLAARKELSAKQRELVDKTKYLDNADLQKDIGKRQSELADKQLDLQIEIQKLQLSINRISESMSFPAAPFEGTIQRVHVKVGEVIQPGAPLMTIAQAPEDDPIVAIVYAPRQIAQSVSLSEPATFYFDGLRYDATPSFVTHDAILGTLYGIYYPILDVYTGVTTEQEFVNVSVPLAYTYGPMYIPLDAVYQSQTTAYVFVVEKNKAVSRTITLGRVFGSFVEVTSGIKVGDKIILTRTVLDGDLVVIE